MVFDGIKDHRYQHGFQWKLRSQKSFRKLFFILNILLLLKVRVVCTGSRPWRAPGCYTPHCPKVGHPTDTPGTTIMLAAKAALWPLALLPQQHQACGLSTAPATDPVEPFSNQTLLCPLWLIPVTPTRSLVLFFSTAPIHLFPNFHLII